MPQKGELGSKDARIPPDGHAIPKNLTLFRRAKAAENPEETGFSGPITTGNLKNSSGLHRQIHPVEQQVLALNAGEFLSFQHGGISMSAGAKDLLSVNYGTKADLRGTRSCLMLHLR